MQIVEYFVVMVFCFPAIILILWVVQEVKGKSRWMRLSMGVFSMVITSYYTYMYAVKSVHTSYAYGYFEPTKKLFTYFNELSKSDDTDRLKSEIKYINTEINKLHWRDEVSYSELVNDFIETNSNK